jgi:hypothetical protein
VSRPWVGFILASLSWEYRWTSSRNEPKIFLTQVFSHPWWTDGIEEDGLWWRIQPLVTRTQWKRTLKRDFDLYDWQGFATWSPLLQNLKLMLIMKNYLVWFHCITGAHHSKYTQNLTCRGLVEKPAGGWFCDDASMMSVEGMQVLQCGSVADENRFLRPRA